MEEKQHTPKTIRRALNVCRWRPYRAECTGSLPTSEVKRRRARLVLGWGTAQEDPRVLPAYLHLPLLCLCVCVVNPCADDLCMLFCLFSKCCFGICCGCGQSLHVSVCLFVCFAVCTEQQSRIYALPICIEHPHSKHACSTTWQSCVKSPSPAAIPRRMHQISSDLRS